MSAVDWSTALGALAPVITGASATDRVLGVEIREWLSALGSRYATVYSDAADAAKLSSATLTASEIAAWEVSAETVHDQADAAARYVEDLLGEPGAALVFNPAEPDGVCGRLTEAARRAERAGLHADAALLLRHHGAVLAARDAKPSGFVAVAPYDGGAGFVPPASTAGRAPAIADMHVNTVRDLETALVAQVAYALEWIALVAYA